MGAGRGKVLSPHAWLDGFVLTLTLPIHIVCLLAFNILMFHQRGGEGRGARGGEIPLFHCFHASIFHALWLPLFSHSLPPSAPSVPPACTAGLQEGHPISKSFADPHGLVRGQVVADADQRPPLLSSAEGVDPPARSDCPPLQLSHPWRKKHHLRNCERKICVVT